MKKKIVEELHELAIQILKKNDDSDWEALHIATRELYEQLTVRVYMQGKTAVDISKKREESMAEPLIEKIKDIVAQMPNEGKNVDKLLEHVLPKESKKTTDLDDFAAHYKETPVFERKTSSNEEVKETPIDEVSPPSETASSEDFVKKVNDIEKKKSLNETLNRGMTIGLNDRLAFTKHLFNDSADDYNRVISQIATIESFDEAQRFIQNHIAPDYNWEGKEQHVTRFMELIEKKFD